MTQKNETNEKLESNTPRLIDTAGELSTTFDFNGKEVYESCGVTFWNKYFIFGGDKNKRQILKVEDCGLISFGKIEFDHFRGACGSTDDVVVLCFNYADSNDAKLCREASSPSGPWTRMSLSTFDHRSTSIATSPGNL